MLLLLVSIVVTSTSCHRAYEFFTGLEFYEGTKIVDVYEKESFESYVLVCDNKVYLSCEDYDSINKAFLYASLFAPNTRGIIAPVLIYEGNVKDIDFYYDKAVLIRTSQNELYSFNLKKKWHLAEKIAENVIHSDHSSCGYAFYVTSDHCLYAKSDGYNSSLYPSLDEKFALATEEVTLLHSGIKFVKVYRDRLFVITTEDKLCELVANADGSASLTDPLLENVNKFEVLDTSHRYINGVKHYFTEEGGKTPLFHVLLNDGSLYVKGIYNTMYSDVSMEQYDEWTLIDNDVSDFSSSEVGVVYMTKSGTAIYNGFDTVYDKDNFLFDKKILLESGAVSVSAGSGGSQAIYVFGSDDKIYCWGDKFSVVFNRTAMENISVFHDEPLVFENK